MPKNRPVATWILLGILVAVFAIQTLTGGSTESEVLIRMGAKFTPLIAGGEYWRLFTAMFLHVGVIHLLMNAYALFVIGSELERILGWKRFLAIYVISGLMGNLASYAFSPHPAAGASGAIFGLIGALAAVFFRYRKRLGKWGRARLTNIAVILVLNLGYSLMVPGIDYLAHLGGLVSGFVLGWFMAPEYEADPVGLRLVDRNHVGRYWPALTAMVVVFFVGTLLVTLTQRGRVENLLILGQAAVDREAWDEAVDVLKQAVDKDPALAVAYFYLGLAHNNLDQHDPAAEAYEAALGLAPDDSASRWNLALTYVELQRYADAETQFEIYRDQNPGDSGDAQLYLDELRRVAP
jgi:rhomboid protease GluP